MGYPYRDAVQLQPFGSAGASLVANLSTATDTSDEVVVGDRLGALTLFVEPTLNSGTAQDITLEAQVKGKQSTSWAAENGNTWNTIGTISAAQITNGEAVYFVLSNMSWWGWFNKLRFRASGASGTYDVTLKVYLEGQ